jgi:hypothetical protein
MNTAALSLRLREFFTLQDAERESRAFPEEARASTTHALALAFQKREAAETLWPRGCTAEALRLAKGSLDQTATALELLGTGTEAKPEWLVRAQAAVSEARARTEVTKLPELEADAVAGDEEAFRIMIDATLEVERAAGLVLATPREIANARRGRRATVIGLAIVVLGSLAWWIHTPLVLHATASGQQPGAFGPTNAVDDDLKTIWLLPDRQPGWLDITFGGARSVSKLRLIPRNPPLNDRGVKDARVTAFLGDKSVRTKDVSFPEPAGADPEWSDIPIDAKCDRIRIEVKSSYKLGAGITEVQVK